MNVFITLLLVLLLRVNGENVNLHTNQGILKGQIEQSRGGRPYFAFYGIPYAKPPLGDLRFKDPVPPESWDGIRDATVLPPPCLYMLEDEIIHGDEDCLYLNVYTPKLTNATLMSVMVYIFGGRFLFGHALPNRYGPQYFMDKDVILITFHYRMGALGFISTGDNVLPGNYGLKDFVGVLKWIQKNIEAFGGNKDRVTVAGGSSGGMTAALALVSPITQGLFHGCISQSGYPLYAFSPEEARKGAYEFASHVGCADDNVVTSKDLVSCLRKLPAHAIIRKNLALKDSSSSPLLYPFGPVIEDESISGAFLVDEPVKLLSRKSDIPWIIGLNSADGGMAAIFAYYNPITARAKQITDHYHHYFAMTSGMAKHLNKATQLQAISEEIRKYFFGDSDISTNAQGYSKMITVLCYLREVKKCVELYKGPLYVYYYDHKNEETFATTYGDPKEDMGVIHGDELISMFNWSEAIKPVTKGIDLITSQIVLTLWTNFLTYGDPNGDGEIIWKPVECSNVEHLVIKNGAVEMREKLLEEESKFLEKLSSLASDEG